MEKKWDRGNVVGLAGELTELNRVKDICGLSFDGYLSKIEVPRTSGVKDEVVVAFTSENMETEITVGDRVLISGCQQTLKDFSNGKVLVFVLADFVASSPNAIFQNDVALTGKIAYKPKFRKTQNGIRITDVFIRVQNELTAGNCFIPCICWHGAAEKVAKWSAGDKVSLLGRYQSREYMKRIETGDGVSDPLEVHREARTAYEISANYIERIGETENDTQNSGQ